jgi:hypothetical protein
VGHREFVELRSARVANVPPYPKRSWHGYVSAHYADGEVLFALDTVAVGVWDVDMRADWYPDGAPSFPLVLGTDGSGRSAALEPLRRRCSAVIGSMANCCGRHCAGCGIEAVEMTLRAGKQCGQRLHLRGRGLNRRDGGRGDLYVRVRMVNPPELTASERELYQKLAAESHFDARELLPGQHSW